MKKLDGKNEVFILKEKEFLKMKKSCQEEIADIRKQIRDIPMKQKRSIMDIEKQIAQIPINAAKEKVVIENEMKEELLAIDIALANETIMLNINKTEDAIVSNIQKIENSNNQKYNDKKDLNTLMHTISLSEKKLIKLSEKISKYQLEISKIENELDINNTEKRTDIARNKKEFLDIKTQIEKLNNKRDELILDIEKIDVEIKSLEKLIRKIKEKIFEHKLKRDQVNNSNKVKQKEYQKQLLATEKDLLNSIDHSENIIKEINRFSDALSKDLSEVNSAINLGKNDLDFHERDIARVETLINNNDEHLKKISAEYFKALNELSTIKDLYPTSKIMLNERISKIYTLIELQMKEKENVELQVDDLDEDLKNKKVQIAIIDQEISKINEKLKLALEFSFNDKIEQKEDNEWKWEIGENKMKAYADLAVLKISSKELFNTINDLEKEIAELKKKHSSLNKLISDTEKINHKKFMKMEDLCSQLELQITRDKNELSDIEKKVHKLENIPINYGNRIEKLKEELRKFKEKESELELTLNDLDRSLESIEKESDRIIKRKRAFKENSINLDYTANLGLLMDPDLGLNMIPEAPKKDFSYYRLNQLLQGAVLILMTVFSLGSVIKKGEIDPLKEQLPIKKSELDLLNMRQEMKDVVVNQNKLSTDFNKFIKNDGIASSHIVSLLQYLSKNTPEDFQVTNLNLEKINNDTISNHKKEIVPAIQIVLNGFYETNLEKAAALAIRFKRTLSSGDKFKSIDFGSPKNSKKLRTNYTIKMVY